MTNDYLKDLDNWDNESQQILLSLAKNNAFISFDEIEKGIYGKAKDSFAKIMIDKKIKRREIHRGLTNIHPFATQYRSNLDVNQIDHRYFVDATKTTYNSVSIITDVDTDNQALEVIKKEFYIDHNLNGQQDPGEYVFHLIIFQSKDGNKVSEAYNASSQPNSNEIVLYLEQGQDVFSSTEKTRSHAKEIAQAIKKWLVKNKDLLSPKSKEIASLSMKELDWMASRKIGNLGGNILKSIQIRKLRGILKQRGIILLLMVM